MKKWVIAHLDDFELIFNAIRWASIFFQFIVIIIKRFCFDEGTIWYNAMTAAWLIFVLIWAFSWIFTLLIHLYRVNK